MRLLRPLVVLPDFLPGPILLLGSKVGVPVPIFLPGIIWAGNRDLGLAGRPQARCWWRSLQHHLVRCGRGPKTWVAGWHCHP